jgi:hypothetical protein
MRYLLNSAVVTSPGRYEYWLCDTEAARRWMAAGPVESTIGYQETAEALSVLLGQPVEINRRMVRMEPGDEALVFRLTVRLADPSVKGRINDPDWIAEHSEIGILSRAPEFQALHGCATCAHAPAGSASCPPSMADGCQGGGAHWEPRR